MEQLWTPTDKLKKNIIWSLMGGELFVLVMLLTNFLKIYSGTISLVLLFVVLTLSATFNVYMWKRMSAEYIVLDETGIEWSGNRTDWELIEEVRLKKEKEKPMFLVIREGNYYHKVPLRLYSEQVDEITKQIEKRGFKITG